MCVCRDAEGTSEERTSPAGGSLLCPEHHGGGQTAPDEGRKNTFTPQQYIAVTLPFNYSIAVTLGKCGKVISLFILCTAVIELGGRYYS